VSKDKEWNKETSRKAEVEQDIKEAVNISDSGLYH